VGKGAVACLVYWQHLTHYSLTITSTNRPDLILSPAIPWSTYQYSPPVSSIDWSSGLAPGRANWACGWTFTAYWFGFSRCCIHGVV